MERAPNVPSPPQIRPPAPEAKAGMPPWPPALQQSGGPLPGQMRVPIRPEYIHPFKPTVYTSANSEASRAVRGVPLIIIEPGYIGRHRSAEYVAAHRQEDKQQAARELPYIGRHRLVDHRPPNILPSIWLLMTDDERRRHVPPLWLHATSLPPVTVPARQSPRPPAPPRLPPLPPSVVGPEPASAVSQPVASRRRLGPLAWAGYQAHRFQAWLNDPERGNNRKAAVGLAALGAIALAAFGGYLAARGHAPHPPAAGSPGSHSPSLSPPESLPPAASIALTHHVDTIWGGVVTYARGHGVHLTEAQKMHIVSQVLQDNGQTWQSARHLPEGYHFVITQQRAQEILSYR